MKSGRTLWAELCYTYDRGVNEVEKLSKSVGQDGTVY